MHVVSLPLTLTACLDRPRFDCLPHQRGKSAKISGHMSDTLHWLPIQQRIFYRITICWSDTVALALLQFTCIAPGWLLSVFVPLFSGELLVPRVNLDYAAPCILNCCSF